jgi:uncharacterized protein YjbI with pentapeptide repeats
MTSWSKRRIEMAQDEHLKLMNECLEKQDINIWNRWREEHPEVKPDLSGIDLKRTNLKNAALQGAILRGANLRGTDLSLANLEGADLNGTNLRRTNLCAANLTEADFRDANLSEANLSKANLKDANLCGSLVLGALMLEADLTEANLEENVKDVMPSQVRTAKNWDAAFYDPRLLEGLGLPNDHNDQLRKRKGDRKPEE